MKKLPSVSLIIYGCNWLDALEITLLSVAGQKQLPDEIIISGCEPEMETTAWFYNFKRNIKLPLIIVPACSESEPGSSLANRSISKSQSEYIIQINSGFILHPCFIKDQLEIARPLQFVSTKSAIIKARYSKTILTTKHWQLAAFSGRIKNPLRGIRIKGLTGLFSKPKFHMTGWTGNLTAFWRKDFLKVNGYNEKISDLNLAEFELAARFMNNMIGRIILQFSAIQYQLLQDDIDKSPRLSTDFIKKITKDNVTFCQVGLQDLSEEKTKSQFIELQRGKISAAIITYNEEKNIERCIKSLTGVADEIVVVDSYSEDETENICKRYSVKFIKRAFEGHIQQKQFALSQANYQHVLSLDADEYLTEELRRSILCIKSHLACQGYSVNRRNFYRGKKINHGGWYPDARIRLFDKEKARWGGQNPHDVVVLDNPDYTSHLKGDLCHNTLSNLEEHKRQTENYARIAANYKFEHGLHQKTAFLKMLLNPLSKFFTMYILKLGFLDGSFGLRISYEESKYTHKKYSLLFKMYKNRSKN